ncbi:MAG: hypothetical protein JW781_05895 [Deltaproteobacteria bacterium]|nr:hypothetical protein [Candidatus Anaeroferrophillacea bacterium]
MHEAVLPTVPFTIAGHDACLFCRRQFAWAGVREMGENGATGGLAADIDMELRHEGWLDMPHGGVSIAATMEMVDLLWQRRCGRRMPYPHAVAFRFADACRIGDRLVVSAVADGKDRETIEVRLARPESDGKVYLQGRARPAGNSGGAARPAVPELPDLPVVAELLREADITALPVYDNCLVCGVHRHAPGLRRRFFNAGFRGRRWIIAQLGLEAVDAGIVAEFRQDADTLHPGALGAILDEICGWSGYIAPQPLYGYTVRFGLEIRRPVSVDERLVFIADEPRGVTRRFYDARGAVLVLGPGREPEIVAVAAGKWLVVPELNGQLDDYQIAEDLAAVTFPRPAWR